MKQRDREAAPAKERYPLGFLTPIVCPPPPVVSRELHVVQPHGVCEELGVTMRALVVQWSPPVRLRVDHLHKQTTPLRAGERRDERWS